ncbi:unnamed protein product [Lactuca saligna]|uniref:Uncharacterized protein n=1 Tax=Lactuca saligna TaxID=75948 RepID=A0AA35V443_LACSI|nr:unnamed protein product [Lactuca saligna]
MMKFIFLHLLGFPSGFRFLSSVRSCFFLSVLGSRFLSSVSPRFFLSVSDFILVRGQIDETCETSEIAPCSLCGCVRIQRLMAAIGVSKAPYFFSTRQVTQLTLVHLWDQILIMNIESYLSKITSQCVTIQMLGRLAEVGTAVKLSAPKPNWVPPSAACLFWCPLFLVLKDLDLFLVLVPSAACLFKSLDKSCLGPLRKAYCSSLNLLLSMRAITKASRNPTVLLEGSTGSNQNVNNADTSTALNNMPKCSPYLSHSFLMSPAGLITCMTQGTTSLLSNTIYAISDAATQDQVPENDVKGISKDKPLIHREQEKHKQFLGFLVPYYKPAEYISLLVTYAGNNIVHSWAVNVPICFHLCSPAGLITCMTQGTTSLLSNTIYAISDAATQDPPGAGKTQTILGLLSAILQPAEYISLLVTYAGNNLVERTYESDINGNKFNTRVHTIRC